MDEAEINELYPSRTSNREGKVSETLLPTILARLPRTVTDWPQPAADVEDYLRALKNPDWFTRANALHMLGTLGTQAPLEPLLDALLDGDASVRATALRVLGRYGPRVPLTSLLSGLNDPDPHARTMALFALAERSRACRQQAAEQKAALKALRHARHDRDTQVRAAARSALSHAHEERPASFVLFDRQYPVAGSGMGTGQTPIHWSQHLKTSGESCIDFLIRFFLYVQGGYTMPDEPHVIDTSHEHQPVTPPARKRPANQLWLKVGMVALLGIMITATSLLVVQQTQMSTSGGKPTGTSKPLSPTLFTTPAHSNMVQWWSDDGTKVFFLNKADSLLVFDIPTKKMKNYTFSNNLHQALLPLEATEAHPEIIYTSHHDEYIYLATAFPNSASPKVSFQEWNLVTGKQTISKEVSIPTPPVQTDTSPSGWNLQAVPKSVNLFFIPQTDGSLHMVNLIDGHTVGHCPSLSIPVVHDTSSKNLSMFVSEIMLPDNKHILFRTNTLIAVCNIQSGQLIMQKRPQVKASKADEIYDASSVVFSPDGSHLIVPVVRDKRFYFEYEQQAIEALTGKIIWQDEPKHIASLNDLQIGHASWWDDSHIVIQKKESTSTNNGVSEKETDTVIDIATQKVVNMTFYINSQNTLNSDTLKRSRGQYLLFCNAPGYNIEIWNWQTGTKVRTIRSQLQRDDVFRLDWLFDDLHLYLIKADGSLSIWNAETGELQSTAKFPSADIFNTSLSKDGQYMLVQTQHLPPETPVVEDVDQPTPTPRPGPEADQFILWEVPTLS